MRDDTTIHIGNRLLQVRDDHTLAYLIDVHALDGLPGGGRGCRLPVVLACAAGRPATVDNYVLMLLLPGYQRVRVLHLLAFLACYGRHLVLLLDEGFYLHADLGRGDVHQRGPRLRAKGVDFIV